MKDFLGALIVFPALLFLQWFYWIFPRSWSGEKIMAAAGIVSYIMWAVVLGGIGWWVCRCIF